MMELLNSPLAEKVPSLVLMVFMMLAFLRYISKRDAGAQALHRESNTIISENTRVLGGVGEIIKRTNGQKEGP